MLAQKGDAEGAKAVWRLVIEFGAVQYAGQAFTDLADLLREEDIDGLRAAYDWAAGLGNPDAAYALDALGRELNRIGDAQGAHKADAQGNLYIADTGNNRVQEIAASTHTQWGIAMTGGDVYTIAGSAKGLAGNSGDGGRATAALLNVPQGIAFDAAGDVLVVDLGNNQVREIAAVTGSQYGQSMTSGDTSYGYNADGERT